MMSFVKAYAQRAQGDAAARAALLGSPLRQTISTLWAQAESAVQASCGFPSLIGDDARYLSYLCDAAANGGLGELLGRQPLCPLPCGGK
jgi:hypothetical protein